MKRLLNAYATALVAWLESTADGLRNDTEARYWRGYEDGVRDALARDQGSEAEEDEFAPGECRGDARCDVSVHVHGCFADVGNCDDPGDHEGYAP